MYFLKNKFQKYGYTISFALFNSANYGVPQKRERLVIFGHKGKERIPLPSKTYSKTGKKTGQKWVSIKDVFTDLKEEEMNYVELYNNQKQYLDHLKE